MINVSPSLFCKCVVYHRRIYNDRYFVIINEVEKENPPSFSWKYANKQRVKFDLFYFIFLIYSAPYVRAYVTTNAFKGRILILVSTIGTLIEFLKRSI